MLPSPNDPQFPELLKKAREQQGLSYSELARKIGVHIVMPSRYENREHSCFCAPRHDVWLKLNQVLFSIDTQSNDLPKETMSPALEDALANFSIEQLIGELKRRGAQSVDIKF